MRCRHLQIKAEAQSKGDGSGILGVLEIAESDLAKGLAEARTVEDKESVTGKLNADLDYLNKFSLTIQCFEIYTALALVRTTADVWNLKYENVPLQKILQTAALTVQYVPMLAVSILAGRMHVIG